MKRVIINIIAFGTLFAACNAYAITVNGELDDWGVNPAGYGHSQWTPFGGITYTVEDQKDYYLNPGWGGQKFDAEAMYYKRAGGTVYLAIVTGHPSSGSSGYVPGDVAIDLGLDGIYEYGIKTTSSNSGKLYGGLSASSWNTGIFGISGPTTIISGQGTDLGSIPFVYAHTYWDETYADLTDDHWVMEMSMLETDFDSSWANGARIHWTMTCGNDAIDLNVPHSPEPASVALVGMGLFGFLKLRRGKKIGAGKNG